MPRRDSLAPDVLDTEAVEPLILKGKSEPVPAFRLLAVRDGDARRRLVAPLVGRDLEREELLRLARDDASSVVVVAGPPGIGKSRLLEDLRFTIEGDARVLAVRASDADGPGPLAALVREALSLDRRCRCRRRGRAPVGRPRASPDDRRRRRALAERHRRSRGRRVGSTPGVGGVVCGPPGHGDRGRRAAGGRR